MQRLIFIFLLSPWHYITSSSFTVSEQSGNSKIWAWHIGGSLNKVVETYYKSGGGEVESYIGSSDGYTGSLTGQWTNGLINLPYRAWHHIEIWGYSGTAGVSADTTAPAVPSGLQVIIE